MFPSNFGAAEEEVGNVVKKSEDRLDQVATEGIPSIYKPTRKRKNNGIKESDVKGRTKQRADKSGTCKNT